MRALMLCAAALAALAGPAVAQDGHAGHQAPVTPPADPHAGHRPPATPDPHAGHAPAATPDPHAGHAMGAVQPADPHAGHQMTGAMPPDTPTSADDAGRPPQAPPPPAAFSGPAHAADTLFGAEVMAAAREQLRIESGAMRTTAVILDRLEAGWGSDDETAFLWDAQGWIGGDIQRFWWKSEGEGDSAEGVEELELQALYSRAVRPFWDVQVGVRQDIRFDGDDATHLVAAVQGVAPYWWEVDAAAFLSTDGDLTARVEAEYDLRLTQRLIAQPRFELDAAFTDAPERGVAAGLSGIEAGLRLRYEITREFAPYVGVEWRTALGGTADLVRAAGGSTDDTRFILGLRAWY